MDPNKEPKMEPQTDPNAYPTHVRKQNGFWTIFGGKMEANTGAKMDPKTTQNQPRNRSENRGARTFETEVHGG